LGEDEQIRIGDVVGINLAYVLPPEVIDLERHLGRSVYTITKLSRASQLRGDASLYREAGEVPDR
jgi:hypothetical protein